MNNEELYNYVSNDIQHLSNIIARWCTEVGWIFILILVVSIIILWKLYKLKKILRTVLKEREQEDKTAKLLKKLLEEQEQKNSGNP